MPDTEQPEPTLAPGEGRVAFHQERREAADLRGTEHAAAGELCIAAKLSFFLLSIAWARTVLVSSRYSSCT